MSISKVYSLDSGSTKIGFAAVNGTTNGYPTIGFNTNWLTGTNAYPITVYFTDSNGSDLSNSAYTWTSNQSWVTVKDGVMRLTAIPTSSTRTVTITATYPGYDDYTYSFTISKWFTYLYGYNVYASVSAECVKSGGTIPSKDDVVPNPLQVGVLGTLYGEHGNTFTSGGTNHWLIDSPELGVRNIYNRSTGAVNTSSETSYQYKLCMYDL